ncbi:hypothetical protein DMB44_08645 [Thermoplasma sp. Kam2015]|uniref:hypothetical protein n=1 Tax=Thermoplasma sp. Kam2015 TaxID=2094122 RepID=UPI000D8C6EAE|nr:hypothetical protein [Thermoplasma sp. Kam2015]PYB67480.1 hypothetical protein DMB44_08645 [Thermoplasma sp. Kam2015]
MFDDDFSNLPEKIRDIVLALDAEEREIDRILSEVENGETGEIDEGKWVRLWIDFPFRHWPFWPIASRLIRSDVNVVPGYYGIKGECSDTLLVLVEPRIIALYPWGCDLERRFRRRMDDARNHLNRCPGTRYIIFWASNWDFRAWKRYGGRFSSRTVVLKPWGSAKAFRI